jgi:hypothetical protein
MKVHIPNSAFIGNIDPFIRGIDMSDESILEITTNDKWVSVHPVVLCIIAAMGLRNSNTKVVCDTLTAKSAPYLERMGLFKVLNVSSGIKIREHEAAGRFIPLTIIKDSDQLSKFITDVIPLLHLEPKQVDAIRYVVSELVRNVLEHSGSDLGAIVSAQYHKDSNMIRIGIVDIGLGIKKTINQSHVASTHLEAIRLALIPGITGTTVREGGTDFNAGAGLFFIKSISKVKRNFFMIYSGDTMYKLLRKQSDRLYADPLKDRHSSNADFPDWKGTVVGVDISLDENEQFSALLDLIREVYSKSVRERREQKYKKPRFI